MFIARRKKCPCLSDGEMRPKCFWWMQDHAGPSNNKRLAVKCKKTWFTFPCWGSRRRCCKLIIHWLPAFCVFLSLIDVDPLGRWRNKINMKWQDKQSERLSGVRLSRRVRATGKSWDVENQSEHLKHRNVFSQSCRMFVHTLNLQSRWNPSNEQCCYGISAHSPKILSYFIKVLAESLNSFWRHYRAFSGFGFLPLLWFCRQVHQYHRTDCICTLDEPYKLPNTLLCAVLFFLKLYFFAVLAHRKM